MSERQNVSRRQYAPSETGVYSVNFGLTTNSSGQFSITVPAGFYNEAPKAFVTPIRNTTVATDFVSAFIRSITDLGDGRYAVAGTCFTFTGNKAVPAPAGIKVDMLLTGRTQ